MYTLLAFTVHPLQKMRTFSGMLKLVSFEPRSGAYIHDAFSPSFQDTGTPWSRYPYFRWASVCQVIGVSIFPMGISGICMSIGSMDTPMTWHADAHREYGYSKVCLYP